MPLCFPNPLGTVSCVCRVLYCQSASVLAAVTHHVYSVTFTFFHFNWMHSGFANHFKNKYGIMYEGEIAGSQPDARSTDGYDGVIQPE